MSVKKVETSIKYHVTDQVHVIRDIGIRAIQLLFYSKPLMYAPNIATLLI